MKKAFIKEKLRNLNTNYKHPSYILEKKLLNEIKMGHKTEAIETLKKINSLERASLAKNSLRSLRNSLIGSCTIFTRAVIEAGIDPEDAFHISDVFIKRIESLENEILLSEFEYEMVEEFINLIHQSTIYNYIPPISQVVKYIYENVTSTISINDLTKITSKSPDYLSRLFKKEVGMTITEFIHFQKVEVAKNLLEFTSMKVTDIAILLNFCNPGYFSNVFKKQLGVSPKEYRKTFI